MNKRSKIIFQSMTRASKGKTKKLNFKGVVDYTFEVWSRFAQCRRAPRNDT